MPSASEIIRRALTLATDRIHALPVVVLMPHSRCNCRCVMCDIWKANEARRELSASDLAPHMDAFRRYRVRRIVLSGGEALMHSNLWTLCRLFHDLSIRVMLLSTGLLLERHAAEVTRWCDEVIVSLDGSRDVHDRIRQVPDGFARLAAGVGALRRQRPGYRISGRCVVQRLNYRDLPNIVVAAHVLGLDQISFLAADVFSTAFNRPTPWEQGRAAEVALDRIEASELGDVIEATIARHADDFASGFVAETPDQLRRLHRYFLALSGDADLPGNRCNAPWVSTVIEADGTVRPCFFHPPLGQLRDGPLDTILNSAAAISFRRNLDVTTDPICRRCVCALHLGPRAPA
jgi:Fe-coproporphyrin III synthase